MRGAGAGAVGSEAAGVGLPRTVTVDVAGGRVNVAGGSVDVAGGSVDGASAGADRTCGCNAEGAPAISAPDRAGDAKVRRSVIAGTATGLDTVDAPTGPRIAYDGNIDAGVGVPRSPGRSTALCDDPGATVGAVASSGADVVCDAGTGTLLAATGFRATSVAPATTVMAPGTAMCE